MFHESNPRREEGRKIQELEFVSNLNLLNRRNFTAITPENYVGLEGF